MLCFKKKIITKNRNNILFFSPAHKFSYSTSLENKIRFLTMTLCSLECVISPPSNVGGMTALLLHPTEMKPALLEFFNCKILREGCQKVAHK
jgi:hypothetical protein